MKTKHLLTGLVLPTLFAACTAEDIVSQQEVAKVDLSNRPVVGNVTLNFGEAESRATLGDRNFNTIEFVKGEDGFGARIIDSYTGFAPTEGYALDHASRKYTPTTYASSNYKYVNAGGSTWSTDALMIEGNYMFYYPYNVKNLARTACEVVLPVKQTVKPNEEDGYRNPIKDLYEGENPVVVGYTFLSATDQDATVSPAIQHLFAYPQITLTNNYKFDDDNVSSTPNVGKEITITKIILSSSEFKEKGTLNHENLIGALRDFHVDAITDTNMDAIPAGTWTARTKDGEYAAKTDDIVDWNNEATNQKNIEVTFEGGLTLAPEASYSFHIVAPAAVYNTINSNEITMQVFLSNDEMFDTTIAHKLTNVTFAAGKRYPTEEYNFPTNGTPSVKENPGTLATVEFTENDRIIAAKDPAELIDDITEFEAFLKGLNNNTLVIKEVSSLADVNEEGEFAFAKTSGVANMKLDAAVVELLKKYLNSGSVEFVSMMQVEDAENAVALNKMTFKAGLEVLNGEVSADGITIAAGQTVTVKGGTLTIPATSTSELKNVVVEAGELVVNKKAFDMATASIQEINGVATGVVGKITLDTENQVSATNLTIAGGQLIVAEDTELKIGGSVSTFTNGTIENNGNILINSNYTLAEDVTLDQKGTVTFNGTAVLTNEGIINNYKNLTVTNTGIVNMMSEEANLVANGVGGNIYNSELAYVKVNGNRDDQTVWYVWSEDVDMATADAIDYYTYAINALEIQGKKFTMDAEWDLTGNTPTYDGANEKGLAWISTVKLTDGASVYAKLAQIVGMKNFIIEGAVTMSGWGMNNESSITLLNNATVEMAVGSVLTVDGITLNSTSKNLTFTADAPAADETQAKVVNNGVVNKGSGTVSVNINWTVPAIQ